jgi:2-haloacid dehalogenase
MLDSIRTCVFDAYGTLLDVNSAVTSNAAAVGATSDPLAALWRQRQLEYTWTRSLMKRYTDFWAITEEALDYALETFSLQEKPGLKQALMKSFLELRAYPDVAPALQQIKTLGFGTAVLSNGTLHMLLQAVEASDLLPYIDLCLSVHELKVYKPDPSVYQYACGRLGISPAQICFVSSNVWDLAGAASFGFRAVRLNRNNQPQEYKFAPGHDEIYSLTELPARLRKTKLALGSAETLRTTQRKNE